MTMASDLQMVMGPRKGSRQNRWEMDVDSSKDGHFRFWSPDVLKPVEHRSKTQRWRVKNGIPAW